MLKNFTHFFSLTSLLTWLLCGIIPAHADFFINQSHRISENPPRLSYGVSVADLDKDGSKLYPGKMRNFPSASSLEYPLSKTFGIL